MNGTVKFQPSENKFVVGQRFVKLINELQPVDDFNQKPRSSSAYDEGVRTPPTASFYEGQKGLQ
jgi:hypothetical protein